MNRTPFGCLLVFCFFGSAHAQVPRPESRTVLTGDSLPVANRLRALDRQIAPLESVPAAAKFIAQSAAGPLWSPIVGLLLEDAATDKWNRTLDELQKIFDDSGDALVATSPTQSNRARRLVHERLAALPPTVLERYRQRVDPA